MKRWHLLATGIATYALALIATAPATLVDAGLQRASYGRLRLAEARGTLWSGSGQFDIRDPDGRNGLTRNVAWRALPESLWRGRLVCEVGLERAASGFPVTLSFSRIELSNASASLPARVLGLAVPRLAPLGLTGDVSIHVDHLAFSSDRMEGNAKLQWRAAGSALTPVSPLGEYELRLDAGEETIDAILSTISGPLQLDGKGSWQHGASVAFLATARVSPQHLPQLAPFLRLIAVERGKGSFELQLK